MGLAPARSYPGTVWLHRPASVSVTECIGAVRLVSKGQGHGRWLWASPLSEGHAVSPTVIGSRLGRSHRVSSECVHTVRVYRAQWFAAFLQLHMSHPCQKNPTAVCRCTPQGQEQQPALGQTVQFLVPLQKPCRPHRAHMLSIQNLSRDHQLRSLRAVVSQISSHVHFGARVTRALCHCIPRRNSDLGDTAPVEAVEALLDRRSD